MPRKRVVKKVKESWEGFRPKKFQLWMEYFYEKEDGSIEVPIPTAITLFVLDYAGCLTAEDLHLHLKIKTGSSKNFSTMIRLPSRAKVLPESFESLSSSSLLPALYMEEFNLCVTGLCSVLRYLLQHLDGSKAKELLGFQGNCLSAPAEISKWTRFCEVESLEALEKLVMLNPETIDFLELPPSFAKFEKHMGQPIRMHNIRKRMQSEKIKDKTLETQSGINGSFQDPIKEFARTQHLFAEGPDCLLSDLVLFVIYFHIFQILNRDELEAKLPLTAKWYKRFDDVSTKLFTSSRTPGQKKFVVPDVPNESLYIKDPARLNPTARVFTRKTAVSSALSWFESSGLTCVRTKSDGDEGQEELSSICWDKLPNLVHPLHGGNLPISRAEKKCQQLENLVGPVLSLSKIKTMKNPVIVDFCSGGGHLAILLAYLLPEATVILVENKAESIVRAMERVQKLNLKNCQFFQGNLDYFSGKFDIGVSLHACGVATDLAQRLCLKKNADFVSAPCCYGKLQENHMLQYPRSHEFKSHGATFENYEVIGHVADQTHFDDEKIAKLEQGYLAMDIIDTDRLLAAKECGYQRVTLRKMKPPSCTPKNNVIIAECKV